MKLFHIKAEGNSMYPILRSGDYLEYEQAPYSALRVNDIVLIFEKKILITHRLVYKEKTHCITRGDSNKSADHRIEKDKIIGRVRRFRRKGKWHQIMDVYSSQSALYLCEIHLLKKALSTYKIPHSFIKGVLVSIKYEGTIPRRIYSDCDILIHPEDRSLVHSIFVQLGYREYGKRKGPEASYVKMVRDIPVVFDLHLEPVFLMTQVPGMQYLYPEELLHEFGVHLLAHSTRSLLHPVDQALYLALHIFHHNFTDITRFQLLDAVIRKTQLSLRPSESEGKQSQTGRLPPFGSAQGKLPHNDIWKELAEIINKYKLEGYVYGVFLQYKQYFSTPIPPSFFQAICPSWLMLYATCYIISHISIFSEDPRLRAGIIRFLLSFILSPNPLWKKALIVWYAPIAMWRFAQEKANDYQ